ncbi:MAG: hypothetical protein IJ874_08590 [Ruminococcus sp.]|nr:hypothetical protein [Ruminococcus sp.]
MKNNKKSSGFLTALKIIMLVLTAVYPLVMVTLSGAGLVYNHESYGSELTAVGVLLIISGAAMVLGALLCLFRKTIPDIISVICSGGGLALCLAMLYKLADHADRAGWTNAYTLMPISDMYKSRIMPAIAPAAIAVIIALIQLFSYEASEERRLRRQKKLEKENAEAPKIIEQEDS